MNSKEIPPTSPPQKGAVRMECVESRTHWKTVALKVSKNIDDPVDGD